jgi:hypothetical protein
MRFKLPPVAWFAILYLVVIILALTAPPSMASLHTLGVSLAIYKVLVFTVLIPSGMVWAAAYYAYDTLAAYAAKIQDTNEGKGYARIVLGLKVLAWGLLLSMLLSLLLGLVRIWAPGFDTAHDVINRYVNLGVTGTAFVLIQDGTFALADGSRARRSQTGLRVIILAITFIGAFFIKLVTDNQSGAANPYHLPFYALLITVVIPYICIWAIGMTSVYELRLYARKIHGVLYKRALQLVAGGLTLVILLSIASQYLTAAFARQTVFALGPLLIIIYVLLVMEAAGLAIVAMGAKQLKKIEDV